MLLNKPLSYFFSTSSIISAPLCWRPIVISLLVRPSICPSVFISFCTSVNPRSLVRNISPFSIALYGPYFTQRVPLSKEGAVTTNQFSRSNVKVLEKYIESLSPCHILSLLDLIWLKLHSWSGEGKVCWSRVMVISDN